MTRDRSLFMVFESKKGGNVTFGDGSKLQIKGKGIISLPRLLDIANVLYVEGLKVNLLSISQICDKDFMVLFSKGKCLVLDESGKKLISGVHTYDNCYGLVPDADIVCNMLGMPKLNRVDNVVCRPCQLGKQTKSKHPGTQTSSTSRPLELLHVDLMGLTQTKSLRGKRYIMVVVDDLIRYSWVILLRSKSDAPEHIEALCTRLQHEKSLKNGVVERKNRLFRRWLRPCCTTWVWLETCGEKLSTLRVIRLTGHILDLDRENVGKFDSRSDEGIFLGYSSTSKVYWVYNMRTKKVMEIVNVVIDEALEFCSENFSKEIPKEILPLEPKDIQEHVDQEPASPSTPSVAEGSAASPDSKSHKEKGPSFRIQLNHPSENIVGNMNELTLKKRTVEPTKVEEALQDESWVEAMHDELLQFQRNDVWTLVPRLEDEHI
ncbi:uncharacterized protein LOC142628998 [Castanea sativa]|uniref:uncharacterized protein LOC142628998 n=1 Tax=Castanea sativa TaxID=21020 RepID=UPI003F64D011